MATRFGPALRELRIHLCQTSPQSQGVRDFVMKYYVQLKKENPGFPILIRECNGIQPRVWARFDKGVERSVGVTNQPADDVMKSLKQLIK